MRIEERNISGLTIKEKARDLVQIANIEKFKASGSWLADLSVILILGLFESFMIKMSLLMKIIIERVSSH